MCPHVCKPVTPRAPPHMHKPRGPRRVPAHVHVERGCGRGGRFWDRLRGRLHGRTRSRCSSQAAPAGQRRSDSHPLPQPFPCRRHGARGPWGRPRHARGRGGAQRPGEGSGAQPFTPYRALPGMAAVNDGGVGVSVLPRSREYRNNCPLPVPGMPGPCPTQTHGPERSLGSRILPRLLLGVGKGFPAFRRRKVAYPHLRVAQTRI